MIAGNRLGEVIEGGASVRRWGRYALAAAASLTVAGFFPDVAEAKLKGAQVQQGQAKIQTRGNHTVIRAADRTIIRYDTFDVMKGESVRFIQPNKNATVLNRITGGSPSTINGRFSANGVVYFVNPAGVMFGPKAVVNVGKLYAAAGSITDQDFNNGINRFTMGVGSVVNLGYIHGEQVHLLGRHVANAGAIVAPKGVVTMTSADGDVFISEQGGKILVKVETGNASVDAAPEATSLEGPAGVTNTGKIEAKDGYVKMMGAGDIYSLAVKNAGVVKAKEVSVEAPTGLAVVSGKIDASGDVGGRVEITGEKVALVDARIDASGRNGGGTVLVGGDYQGKGELQNAQRTFVDDKTKIDADAKRDGDGGRVIVWSDEATSFHGRITARGGEQAGDGGFVELSSKGNLVQEGRVDLRAKNGLTGTLLLDPLDIAIVGSNGVAADGTDSDNKEDKLDNGTLGSVLFGDAPAAGTFTINESEIEGTDANIILQATRNITAGGTFTDGKLTVFNNRDLTLTTENTTGNGGGIDLSGVTVVTQGTGTVTISAGTAGQAPGTITLGPVTTGGGAVALSANGAVDLNGAVATSGGNLTITGSPAVTIDGTVNAGVVTLGNATQVGSISQTAAITAATLNVNASGNVNMNVDANAIGTANVVSTGVAASVVLASTGDLTVASWTTAPGAQTSSITVHGGTLTVTAATMAGDSATLRADEIDIVALDNTGGTLNIRVDSAGNDVILNAAAEAAGDLHLTTADLDGITAGTLLRFTAATGGVLVEQSRSFATDVTIEAATVATAAAQVLTTTGAGSDLTLDVGTAGNGGADPLVVAVSGQLNVTAGGAAVDVSSGAALTIGTVNLNGAASAATITTTAGAIAVGGVVTGLDDTVVLNSNAGVTQTQEIIAAILDVTGSTSVTLNDADNQAARVSFVSTGDIAFTNKGSFTVDNINADAGANAVTLVATDGGTINETTNDGTVKIVSAGLSITAAGGIGTTSTLDLNATAGNISLASGTGGANVSNQNGFVIRDVNLAGALTVTAVTGDITDFNLSLSIGGPVTLTTQADGADINLNDLSTAAPVLTISVNTIGAGGNATLNFAEAIDLGNSTVGGNLSVTSSNNSAITDSGNVVVGGTSAFVTTGNLTLNSVGNDFTGAVTLPGGAGNVVIRDLNAIVLGPTDTGTGTLQVTAGSGITQSAGAFVTGTGAGPSTFDGGTGPITLTNATNNFRGEISLITTGAGNVAITDVSTIIFGTSSLGTGTFTVVATGVSQVGPITQAAGAGLASFTVSLDTNPLVLTNAGNDFRGSIRITSTDSKNSADVSLTNISTIDIRDTSVGSDLTLLSSGGNITDSVSVLVENVVDDKLSVTTTAGGSTITIDQTDYGSIDPNAAGGAAVVTAPSVVLSLTNVNGDLTVTATAGSITLLTPGTAIDAKGTVTMSATGGGITLSGVTADGDISLTGDFVINTAGGLNAQDGNVTVIANAGDINIVGGINAALPVPPAVKPGHVVLTAAAGTIDTDGVTARGNVTFTSNEVNITGNVSSANSGTLSFLPAADNVPINVGAAATGGAGSLDLSTAEIDFLQDGFANIVIGVPTTGEHQVTVGTASFKDRITINTAGPAGAGGGGGDVNITGRLDTTGSTTNNAGASITINGSHTTTTLAADVVTPGAPILILDSIELNAASVTLDTTNGGAVAAGALVTLGTSNVDTISKDAAFAGAADLTVNGGTTGVVTFEATVGNGTAARDLRNLSVAGSLSAEFDAVQVTNDLTIRANTIQFNGVAPSVRSTGGAGTLRLEPTLAAGSIDVGTVAGGVGTLVISEVGVINQLDEGFADIVIGRTDGTGAITIGAATFRDDLTVGGNRGGGSTITLTDNLSANGGVTAGDVTLRANTITQNAGQITTAATLTVDSAGNVTLDQTNALADVDVTADGTFTFVNTLTIEGDITAGTAILTAPNIGTSAADRLVTDVDNLTANAGAGNIFIDNTGPIALGSVGGSTVFIDSTGSITGNGPVSAAVAVVLDSGGTIGTSAASRLALQTPVFEASAAGGIFVSNNAALTLGTAGGLVGVSSAGGEVNVDVGNNLLTVAEPVNSGNGAITLRAADIDFTSTINSGTSATTINEAPGIGISLGDPVVGIHLSTAELGQITADGLILITAGDISLSDAAVPASIGTSLPLNAGDNVLLAGVNTFAGDITIDAANGVVLTAGTILGLSGGTLTTADAATTINGPFFLGVAGNAVLNGFVGDTAALNGLTVTGDLTLNAGIAGPIITISSTGAVSVGGNTVLGGATIIAGTDVSFDGKVDSDGTPRALTVNTSGNGVTTFGGTVGQASALDSLTTNADGSTRINGGIPGPGLATVRTDNNQTYNDPVFLGADTVITATAAGADVFFNSSVDSDALATPRSLAVNASGDTVFLGLVGNAFPLSSLTTDLPGSTTITGTAVIANVDVIFLDPVVLTQPTIVSGQNVVFTDTVDGAFALVVTATTSATFQAAVGDATPLASLIVNGGGLITLDGGTVETTGQQNYANPVVLAEDAVLTSTTSDVVFASTVNGGFALTVNSPTTTAFNNSVGNTTPLASLTTNAGGLTNIAGPVVATTGGQQFGDAVVLTASPVTFSGGSVNFTQTLNGNAAATINSAGATTFGGAVGGTTPLISLVTDAAGSTAINGGLIQTLGDQAFNDAVTLGLNTSIIGNNVTFASTVNGAFTLAVDSGAAGLTTFGGAVGGATPLVSVTTDADGATAINGGAITTTQDQTYLDPVTLGSPTTTLAGNDVTFAQTLNGASALTVNTAGGGITTFSAPVGATVALTSLTTNADGTTAINGGSITTTADQTYNDAVTLGNPVNTLTGNDVTFNGTVNGASALTVNSIGNGVTSFNALVGGTTPLISLTTNADGKTALNAGTLTTTGDQTYNDAVTMTGDTTLVGNDVTFNSTLDGANDLTVNTTGNGSTAFNGPVGQATPLTNLTTNADGTTFLASLITTTQDQTYNDAVIISGATVLAGNDVTFASTVNGNSPLTVNTSGNGVTTFGGAVGGNAPLVSLTTNADGTTLINGGLVVTTGDQTYNDAVTIGLLTTLEANDITFDSTLDGGFALFANSNGNGVTTFNGVVGGVTPLGQLETNADGRTFINGGAVTTTGDQNYLDPVTIGANTVLAGNDVRFQQTLDGGFTLLVNTSGGGDTLFNGAVGGATPLASLTTNADGRTLLNAGVVNTTGDQTFLDPVLLGLTTTLNGNDVLFDQTVDGAFGLTVNTGGIGTTTFNGPVGGSTPLSFLTTNADGTTAINGGLVSTTGDQTYDDAVTLGANTVLNGNDITFASTLDGGFDLLVNTSGNGVTTFGGAVGGSTPLASLTTNADGRTEINGGLITTAGDQAYLDPVLLDANTVLNGNDITFDQTLDGAFTLLINTSGNGVTTFNGPVGGIIPLVSLETNADGTTVINGGIVNTTGDQLYNSAVILGANTVLSGNDITFVAALDSDGVPRSLTVNTAGNGVTTFGGPVGQSSALLSLTTNADGVVRINAGTITTTGDQTYNDVATVGADTTLNGVNITFGQTLDGQGGAFGLLINGSGVTTFNGAVGGSTPLTFLTTDAPGTTVINGGLVTTTGDQTYNDPVTIGANTVLNGQDLTFAQTLDGGFTLAVNSGGGGVTTFGGAVGGTTPLASLTTNADGRTDINGGAVTTTGDQLYLDPVTIGALTTLIGNDITFDQTLDGAFALFVNTTGNGDTTFNGVVGGTTPLGNLETNADGRTLINGGSITTSGDQTYLDPVLIGANTTLNGNDLLFNQTIDGGFTLLVNSTGGGLTTFNGVIGGATPLASLTTNADGNTNLNAGTVTTTGDQSFLDPVLLGASTTLNGNDVLFDDTLDGGFALIVNTTGNGTTTFNGAVGGSTSLASLTTNADGTTAINGGLVTTTGDQTYNDDVTLGANTILNGNDVLFDQTLNGGFSLAVNTTGGGITTFGGIVGGSSPLASLTTNADGRVDINGGAVTTSGDQTYNDAATIGANTTLAGNDVTFAQTLNGGFTLLVNSTGNGVTTFGGVVGGSSALVSLTTNADGKTAINGGAVTTTQDQLYNDAVTIGANTVLAGNDVTFASTLNGGFALLVNSDNKGVTTFGGAVGGTTPLASLATNADGVTRINGGLIATTGAQLFNDAVTLGADAKLTASAITFDDTVDGKFDLTANTTGNGDTRFNDRVGATNALASLTTNADGRTLLNGGLVRTSGAQSYGDDVLLGRNTTVSGTNITFGQSLNGGFTLLVNGSGTTRFTGSVGTLDPLVSLTTSAAGSTVIAGGIVRTTGAQTYRDDVSLAANTILRTGAAGRVQVFESLTGPTFTLLVDSDFMVGSPAVNDFTGNLRSLEVNRDTTFAADNKTSLRTTLTQLYHGPASVESNAALTANGVTFDREITSPSNNRGELRITLTGSGVATFTGAVGQRGTAKLPLSALVISGGSATRINGGVINTTGTQSYGNAVTLGADAALAGGNTTFVKTVKSTGANRTLTVASTGVVAFKGAVGGNNSVDALQGLAVTADAVQAVGVRTTLDQAYTAGTVTVKGNYLSTNDGGIKVVGNTVLSGNTKFDTTGAKRTSGLLFRGDVSGGAQLTLDTVPDGAGAAVHANPADVGIITFALTGEQGSVNVGQLNINRENNAGRRQTLEPMATVAIFKPAADGTPGAYTGAFEIKANGFQMSTNERLTALGNLTIDVGNGEARLSDITALGTLNVQAGQIVLQRRAAGTTLLPGGGSKTDLGSSYAAGLAILFEGAVVDDLNPLFPRPIFGTSNGGGQDFSLNLRAFNNFRLAQPLSVANLVNGSGIDAVVLAGIVEGQTVVTEVVQAPREIQLASANQGIGEGLIAELEDLGIFARDLDLSQLIAFLEGIVIYNDVPGNQMASGVIKDEDYRVTKNRLSYDGVKQVLEAYYKLFFEADLDEDNRPKLNDKGRPALKAKSEDMAKAINAAATRFKKAKGAGAIDPLDFRKYVESTAEEADALKFMNGLRDLFEMILPADPKSTKGIGVTPVEAALSRTVILRSLDLQSISAKELESAILSKPLQETAKAR